MKFTSELILLCCLLSGAAYGQPQFGPVRLDPATDENFYFPTIAITPENHVRCTWASANPDWIGAYGREVDMNGAIVGALDTLDIASTSIVSCPPLVEYQRLTGGAWCKMTYHG